MFSVAASTSPAASWQPPLRPDLHFPLLDVNCSVLQAGFRNSGLTLSGKQEEKVVVAVRSTHGLEVPLTNDTGKVMVSQEYLQFLLNKANAKLEDNLQRIQRFEIGLRQNLGINP